MKYGFIGFGNLATAFFEVLKENPELEFGYTSKSNSFTDSKIKNFKTIKDLIKFSDIIILAIKPQQFEEILDDLKENTKPIISLLAGKTIEFLDYSLSHKSQILRLMPNLAVQFGKSVTAYNHNFKDETLLTKILNDLKPTGAFYFIPEIDFAKFTVVFGSGPAIILKLLQEFQSQIDLLSLPRQSLDQLIDGTISYKNTDQDFSKLIQKVASKGGVTEAALLKLNNIDQQINDAFSSGEQRASNL